MNRWAAGAAVPTDAGSTAPKAYLQYILFNKNMSMAQHGHHMVSEEAGSSWQHLQLRVPIEEIGYIYIYVINESMDGVDVYFDDAEVQLIDAPLTSASDYYPYGLPICYRSYSSEHYRYGYQGQFAEKDEETGWNAFELRMYDPVIGRWMAVDPYGQYYSPYLSMNNSPIMNVDIDGGFSKFGAWWRNGFSMKGVYQSGANDGPRMWGFNRGTGNFITETGMREKADGSMEEFTFSYEESEFRVGKKYYGYGGPSISIDKPNFFGSTKNLINKSPMPVKFLGNSFYTTADNFYISFLQVGNSRTNLEGKGVYNNEVTEAGINTLISVIPYTKVAKAGGLTAPQFSTMLKGTYINKLLYKSGHTIRGWANTGFNNISPTKIQNYIKYSAAGSSAANKNGN
jgi:RHS repeat-associated protein